MHSRDVLKRFLLGWIPFWAYTALVIHGSVASPDQLPPVLFQVNDKLIHGLEFFLLFWLSLNAFQKTRILWLASKPLFWAVAYGAFMGVLTEGLQAFSPGRFSDPWDFVADFTACLVGAVIYLLLTSRKSRKIA